MQVKSQLRVAFQLFPESFRQIKRTDQKVTDWSHIEKAPLRIMSCHRILIPRMVNDGIDLELRGVEQWGSSVSVSENCKVSLRNRQQWLAV